MDADRLNSLTVINSLPEGILDGYKNAIECGFSANALSRLYSAILKNNAEDNLLGILSSAVKKDENVFSVKSSLGVAVSQKLKNAFIRDLGIVYGAALEICEAFKAYLPELAVELGNSDPDFTGDWANVKTADNLAGFYAKNGCGMFAFNAAFKTDGANILPLKRISGVTLEELKEYSEEKLVIAKNIEAFIGGKPYANMLFYGDKGTGKSSTVHAMLTRYQKNGLRLIELPKSDILQLSRVLSQLPKSPLKFMIFIDDLTLSDKDESFTLLKAALEGSIEGLSSNVMFVATSNRRHIVSESFDDRKNNLHLSDTIAEQLSLSDRFGLTVLFDTPDKKLYIDIICQLLDDECVKYDREEITKAAESFALRRGGRSPRRAKQFVAAVSNNL